MPPPGKRASDRKSWSRVDRARFQMYRAGRLLYVVVPVVAAVFIVLGQHSDAVNRKRNDDRDEARKYQACTQRVAQTASQNLSNQILRDSLATNRHVRLVQIRQTKDPVLRKAFRESARLSLVRLNRITFPNVPDCAKTYPRGFAQSSAFPDLVPSLPPVLR